MEQAEHRIFSELIQQIYSSVSHPEGWRDTAASIAQACRADGASIWMSDLDSSEVNLMATTYADPRVTELYLGNYATQGPLYKRLESSPEGRFYTGDQLMSREEFVKTPVYQQLCEPAGLEYIMGGFIAREGNRFAVIWVYRGPGEDFTEKDLDCLEFLRPHLAQALAISSELQQSEQLANSGMAVMDKLAMAMILLDENGMPVAHNARAEVLVSQGVLNLSAKGLHLSSPRDDRRLQELVNRMARPQSQAGMLGGGLMLEGREGCEIEVLILPYRTGEAVVDSLASPVSSIVFFRSADAPVIPRQQLLRDLYGLTVAEVRVCMALLEGESVKDIAHKQGVSRDAVRFHCKNILRKTGNNRQTDLIRTLSRSLINLAGEDDGPNSSG